MIKILPFLNGIIGTNNGSYYLYDEAIGTDSTFYHLFICEKASILNYGDWVITKTYSNKWTNKLVLVDIDYLKLADDLKVVASTLPGIGNSISNEELINLLNNKQ